jgi:hypothetical protein
LDELVRHSMILPLAVVCARIAVQVDENDWRLGFEESCPGLGPKSVAGGYSRASRALGWSARDLAIPGRHVWDGGCRLDFSPLAGTIATV